MIEWLNAIDETGFRASLSILWEGFIRPTNLPLCIGRAIPGLEEAHRSACFSATALDRLQRLVSTRSLYGIGFTHEFLQSNGGRPVQYLRADSAGGQCWVDEVNRRALAGPQPSEPIWRDTPFVDILDSDEEDTRWEEEWRVPGGLRFQPADVAFVFLPEDLHDAARRFFADHQAANTGPAYLGLYLDPGWTRERIEAALPLAASSGDG